MNDLLETYGDDQLCAWAVSESESRVQTRNKAIARLLKKEADCRLVGWAVKGAFLQIYGLPYTLGWVTANLLPKMRKLAESSRQ